MLSEGSFSGVRLILNKVGIGQGEGTHPSSNVGKARREFKRTGTLRPQMVHVDPRDNLAMPPMDVYFEPQGHGAQPAFPQKFRAAVAQLKPKSEGHDRLIVNYLPALDRIVWSPAVNSDMNLLHAIGSISGAETVPDPQVDRYHMEIGHDRVDISTSDAESTIRLLAFLEATIPDFVNSALIVASINYNNSHIGGVFIGIQHLRQQFLH